MAIVREFLNEWAAAKEELMEELEMRRGEMCCKGMEAPLLKDFKCDLEAVINKGLLYSKERGISGHVIKDMYCLLDLHEKVEDALEDAMEEHEEKYEKAKGHCSCGSSHSSWKRGKETSGHHHAAFTHIANVLSDKPCTWKEYEGKPGEHMAIIDMEITEMQKAFAAMRATPPTKTHAQFVHEVLHVAAAAIYAYEAMTCDSAVDKD